MKLTNVKQDVQPISYIDNPFVLDDGRIVADTETAERLKFLCRLKPESKQEDRTNFGWNEYGIAEVFAEVFDGELLYCVEDKLWYSYSEEDGVWVGDLLPPRGILAYFLDIMRLYAMTNIADNEVRTNYLKLLDKMYDVRSRDRISKDVEAIMRVKKSDLDAKPHLLNLQNGTFDMKTGRFRGHRQQDLLTMKCNARYDRNAKSRRFEQFVREVCCDDSDKASFLKRALGYSLLGDAREECMFILYGKTTRNGKSTLLHAIKNVMGDYGTVANVSIICKQGSKISGNAANSELAALRGKRFVTMSESDQYGKLDAEMIKTMTGGEDMSVRDLYEKKSTFRPQFKLWLSCNDLPGVTDNSLFTSERLKVITFDRHFSAEERDVTLKSYFAEEEVKSAILNWLIEGWKEYKSQGLMMADHLKEVVKEYEDLNNIVLQFFQLTCVKEEKAFTPRKELYSYYKMWCKENGYYNLSSTKFYEAMRKLFREEMIVHGVRGFKGLRYAGEQ